jgi:hypothetical protein
MPDQDGVEDGFEGVGGMRGRVEWSQSASRAEGRIA